MRLFRHCCKMQIIFHLAYMNISSPRVHICFEIITIHSALTRDRGLCAFQFQTDTRILSTANLFLHRSNEQIAMDIA